MTKRYLKWLALVAILGLVAAACGGDGGGATTPAETETTEPTETETGTGTPTGTGTATPTDDGVTQGGTVNVLLLSELSGGLDINKSYYTVGFSFFRCCLARTLMAFRGLPVEEGGNEAIPDLAAEPPVVSADGLTWTFTLKPDIAYGPPLDDLTVKTEDIVRAIERGGSHDPSP